MVEANGNEHKKPRRIPVNDLEAQEHWERRERELLAPPPDNPAGVERFDNALELDGNGGKIAVAAEREAAETSRESLPEAAEAQAAILAEMEDRWLRAAADLDNYRKRFDREIARLRQIDRETVLRAWLEVVDNMERALCADGASSNPWYEGMEAIHQQMLDVLASFGCAPFVPMGEKFDPERHEAVATADLPDQPEGTIVEVTQTGYILDGKTLRPAKVIAVKRDA